MDDFLPDREELEVLIRLGRKYKWAAGDVRKRLEEGGINLVRTDFYSESPTLSEIESSFEYVGSTGINDSMPVFDDPRVFDLEKIESFAFDLIKYGQKFRAYNTSEEGFYWRNTQFSGSDVIVLYSIIRKYRPRTVIEIGSGFSSHVISTALLDAGGTGRLICIDPEPRTDIQNLPEAEIVRMKVQDVDLDIFDKLEDNDIIFYDGSHTLKTGSDTVYFYLKILPYISSEVFVHAHDIRLPYPRNIKALTDSKIYWSEQYILFAHLLNTERYKVLYASELLRRKRPEILKQLMAGRFAAGGASLWYKVANS
jgi:hypothetical protein